MGLYIQHKETSFKVGDTIKVHQRIVEGGKERIQVFEGLVIKVRGHKGEKSFTVRKISSGVGVERIWQADSPFIQTIEVTHEGHPSRSKLYYLRSRTGRLALKVRSISGTKESNGTIQPVDQEVEQSAEAAEPVAAKAKKARKAGGKQSKDVSSE